MPFLVNFSNSKSKFTGILPKHFLLTSDSGHQNLCMLFLNLEDFISKQVMDTKCILHTIQKIFRGNSRQQKRKKKKCFKLDQVLNYGALVGQSVLIKCNENCRANIKENYKEKSVCMLVFSLL